MDSFIIDRQTLTERFFKKYHEKNQWVMYCDSQSVTHNLWVIRKKPPKEFIFSTADPAASAKKLTKVALRRSVMKRTVDQIFESEEREEIEEEMKEND